MNREALKQVAASLAKEYAQHQLNSGFLPDGLHPYYDETGKLIYFKIRLKHPSGEKWIRPFHYNSLKNKFIMGEPKLVSQKPLYNLSELKQRPNDSVFIHEGELCCDKSSRLGLLSVTSGGTTSVKQTDWSPLSGRTVYLWPDNDPEGLNYAKDVAQILLDLECNVKIIDITKLDLPEKGDVIDWLNINPKASHADILSLPMRSPLHVKPEENNLSNEQLINQLANLPEIDYQRQRKTAAEYLSITLSSLDKIVKNERIRLNTNTKEMFLDIEPWPEPVDLNSLLNELKKLIDSVVAFQSEHESEAIALFIIHTYCFDAADCSPILNVSSPEKRCGKSTLLSVLQKLVNRPLIGSNISPAAVYRSIEKWKPTLIIDEADSFMRDNEGIRGVINSGHTRDSAFALRCVGDDHEPYQFSTWCPKVIAGIGHLADTIEDRSIIIQLRRKLESEPKVKVRDISKHLFKELTQKCVRTAIDNTESLCKLHPAIPAELNDRAADNWTPLLSIAQLAGNECLNKATFAAVYLFGTKQEPLSINVELLHAIKKAFHEKDVDSLSTHDLLNLLCQDDEAPWSTYNRGKTMSARQLARILKEFNIHSKDIRMPTGKNLKGYSSKDFSEAYSRYLPSSLANAESSATTLQSAIEEASEQL